MKKLLMTCLLLFTLIPVGFAEHAAENEKFAPGDFIFGHIRDGYSWHVTNIGEREISIPLPVIIKSSDRGWFVFMSSKLEHGHSAYKGFYISHKKEHIGKLVEQVNGEEVRPFDISITKNILSLIIAAIVLCVIFLNIANIYTRNPMKAPGGFRGALEVVILFVVNEVVKPCIGKGYEKYVPYMLSLFFFILLNNIMGLIPVFPGGANVTGNIAITMILALCTFFIVQFSGTKEYWKEIFWPEVPLALKAFPLIPLLEFIGIFTKPIALMIRLFANILAGHIIALSFMALIFIFGAAGIAAGTGVGIFSVLFSVVMMMLELLVVFIQAYVFTLLSSVFIGLARVEPHHAKH